ncbi:4-hydroxy-2-oxoheptanedioate aldolase [Kineococcus xinjiangensis]|uniref:4-hydroxy-2-oxoheptanedioate aldolase n=1 Tax=Kineococcus xinjiangensis TaxID=512762 RepID=A0A2S6IHR2_9ACTN|nr:aldolase/citrate lyase family protein [Kineococcus xinjiangensis]PPK93738.1 4-hydroxy-2-oxoheptanedioate aldolase [Kineococcus xinjiangensis]
MPHPLLTSPGPLLGGWSSLASPAAVASLARSGFRWVVLDMQHGEHDDRSVRDCLRGTTATDAPVLVRPPRLDTQDIGRALDAGAAGVVVPMVSTPEQARHAARACRYAPTGNRSWGPHALDAALSAPAPAEADAAAICAVMVETRDGLANVDAIAATEGVDVVFVGPFDLSLELGTDVDALLAADGADDPLPTVVRACRERGVVPGAFGSTAERSARFLDLGFRFVAAATDSGLIQAGARQRVADLADRG